MAVSLKPHRPISLLLLLITAFANPRLASTDESCPPIMGGAPGGGAGGGVVGAGSPYPYDTVCYPCPSGSSTAIISLPGINILGIIGIAPISISAGGGGTIAYMPGYGYTLCCGPTGGGFVPVTPLNPFNREGREGRLGTGYGQGQGCNIGTKGVDETKMEMGMREREGDEGDKFIVNRKMQMAKQRIAKNDGDEGVEEYNKAYGYGT